MENTFSQFIVFDKENDLPLASVDAGDSTHPSKILSSLDKFENEVYCMLS